jgi:hypothetical protein
MFPTFNIIHKEVLRRRDTLKKHCLVPHSLIVGPLTYEVLASHFNSPATATTDAAIVDEKFLGLTIVLDPTAPPDYLRVTPDNQTSRLYPHLVSAANEPSIALAKDDGIGGCDG